MLKHFDSLEAFIDYACRDSDVDTDNRSSRIVSTSNYLGTRTFSEALDLALYGWTEGRDRAAQLANRIVESVTGSHGVASRWRSQTGVTGSRPHVPNAIAGKPNSMIRYTRQPVAHPIVSVVLNLGASGDITGEEMISRGAATAALVDVLEATGRRCEVIGVSRVSSSTDYRDTLEYRITLKRAQDALDADVMAFALSNPAMLRRLVFSARETEDTTTRKRIGIPGGYGQPQDTDDRGDVYVPAMKYGQRYGDTWVQQQLRSQGVEIGE